MTSFLPLQDNLRWLKRQESIKSRQRKISGEMSLASLEEADEEDLKNNQQLFKRQSKDVVEQQSVDVTLQQSEEATKLVTNSQEKEEMPDENPPPTSPICERPSTPKDKQTTESHEKSENDETKVNRGGGGGEEAAEGEEDGSVAEKELTYLNFIQEVTSDLLSTGHISERILAEIFKRHVEEYGEEKIPPAKAEELHRQLRKDLGFVEDGEEEEKGGGGGGLTKSLVRDMEEIVSKGETEEV